jgi:hypothetical protein
MTLREKIGWGAMSLLGACALAVVAFQRGEHVNALWIVAASVSVNLIAYRFYARYIARNVMQLDATRPTPAIRRADGLDYVATDRCSPRRWAISPARSGSSPASCSQARCRTS